MCAPSPLQPRSTARGRARATEKPWRGQSMRGFTKLFKKNPGARVQNAIQPLLLKMEAMTKDEKEEGIATAAIDSEKYFDSVCWEVTFPKAVRDGTGSGSAASPGLVAMSSFFDCLLMRGEGPRQDRQKRQGQGQEFGTRTGQKERARARTRVGTRRKHKEQADTSPHNVSEFSLGCGLLVFMWLAGRGGILSVRLVSSVERFWVRCASCTPLNASWLVFASDTNWS